MNYGIDIELSIKGQDKLKSLEQQINSVAEAAKKVTTFDVSGASRQTTSELERQRKLYQDSGKERRQNLILANRELQVEQLINEKLAKRAEIQESQQQARRRLENVALGAGFPLLFGGGAGSVLGGIAGSFVGEGFGGQIILSAIGQQIDTFTASVSKLGQALNPLKPDIDEIIQKTGLVGTETGNYIKSLEESGNATAALTAATSELSFIVGDSGVQALKNFGTETQDLSNQLSKLFTQVGASLADLLDGPVAALVNYIDQQTTITAGLRSEDPKLKALSEQYSSIFVPSGFEDFPIFSAQVKEQEKIFSQIKARQRELADEEEKRLNNLNETNAARLADINLLEQQIVLAGMGNDLTDEAVFLQRQKIIEAETYVKLQDALEKKLETETILLEEQLKLRQLNYQRQQAIAREQEQQRRETERQQKEEERLVEKMNEQYLASRQAHELAKRDLAIVQAENNYAKIQAKHDKDRAIRMDTYRKKYNEALSEQEQDELVATQLLQSEAARLEHLKAQNAEFYRQVELATTLDDRTKNIVNNLDSLFTLDLDLTGVLSINTIASELERVREELEKLISPANSAARAAEGIGNAFSTSFIDTINGSVSAQQALADFFRNTANAFMDMAGQIIAKYIQMQILGILQNFFPSPVGFTGAGPYQFGGGNTGISGFGFGTNILTGKANGGPVSAGTPYLVGERGPELFMPRTSGSIYPNDAMGMGGSNIVVNVDATGSSVGGDPGQASQLGKVIGLAVQQELVKQKRPGGLLA